MKRFLLLCILTPLLTFFIFPQNGLQTYELPNGLRVILSPLPDAQATCVFIYHAAGSRDEPQDLKGGSLILSKLMVSGATKNLERLDRIYSIVINGGSLNFFLNYDYSYSSSIIPDNFLQSALWFESERINSLKFNPRSIKYNTNVIYFYYSRMKKSSSTFNSFSWIKSQVFTDTLYANPLFGDLANLRNYNPGRIEKLYTNYSNPKKIILVVCGKFSIPEVKRDISRHFTPIAEVFQYNQSPYKIIKPNNKFFHRNILRENISQHSIFYGFRTPSSLSYDYLPFQLVKYHLLDKRISQIEDILLDKNELEVDIGYEFTDNIESNALIMEVSSPSRLTMTKLRYILDQEFASLGKIPIPNGRIRLIKSIMRLDFYKKLSNLGDRCKIIAQNYHLFKDLKFEERFLSRLDRITPMDTMKIGKKYFLKENQTILNVYKK